MSIYRGWEGLLKSRGLSDDVAKVEIAFNTKTGFDLFSTTRDNRWDFGLS